MQSHGKNARRHIHQWLANCTSCSTLSRLKRSGFVCPKMLRARGLCQSTIQAGLRVVILARLLNASPAWRRSELMNLFPVINLRPDVELMHLLRMRRYYSDVQNTRHWTGLRFEYAWIFYLVGSKLRLVIIPPPPLKNWCGRHTLFTSVRPWVSAPVCASRKPCDHHISKTSEGNFTQF